MSSLADTIRKTIPPLHPEGRRFVLIALVITVVLALLWAPLGWIAAGLTLWVALFFRDPRRTTPQAPGLVVSPADGRVSMIVDVEPPPELGLPPGPRRRVSVFMSVFDVHVNRMPATATVRRVVYTPGKFLNADLDKASEDNERNALVLDADGTEIAVVQIAGLVARRILCFVKEGDALGAGMRFGLIRFGSRLDVYLPAGTEPLVAVGQRAVAGETLLADLSGKTRSPGPYVTG